MDIRILDCSICFERFTDSVDRLPRILSCGHSFCHSCLDVILQSSKLCSTCKESITYATVDKIPINFALKTISNECPKLEENSRSKHDLSSDGVCPLHYCPNHFLCLDCQVLACGTCIVLNHKTCKSSTITEGLDMLKEKYLAQYIAKQKKANEDLCKQIDQSTKEQQIEIEKYMKKVEQARKIIKENDDKKSKLLDLESNYKDKEKSLKEAKTLQEVLKITKTMETKDKKIIQIYGRDLDNVSNFLFKFFIFYFNKLLSVEYQSVLGSSPDMAQVEDFIRINFI